MSYKLNAVNAGPAFQDFYLGEKELNLIYKRITPISGSLTRDGNGYIATITNGTTTLTITRDGNNLISSVTNGTWVLTINRSGGYITSWSVA